MEDVIILLVRTRAHVYLVSSNRAIKLFVPIWMSVPIQVFLNWVFLKIL